MSFHSVRLLALLLLCLCPVLGQKVKHIEGKAIPTALIEEAWILGTDVAEHWKGLPTLVNGPGHRTRAYPGQRLTFAIGAKGEDRDSLLKNATYSFTVEFGGATAVFHDLHPTQIRQIKAEGADFVRSALKAANVDLGQAEAAMSMVSLALFDVEWRVPVEAKDGTAKLRGRVVSPTGGSTPLKEGTLDVWSFDRVAKDGGFKQLKETGEWMMTYYKQPEPSRLLHVLRLSMDDKNAFKPNVLGFYAEVLKSDPGAARDLMVRLKAEKPPVRLFGMVVLKEAGYDLAQLLSELPEEEQASFKLIPMRLPPLPDPYDLTPSVEDPSKVPMRLDMLWSRFLATGDPKPVKAVASVLEWRIDGKAFLDIRKSGKKVEKVTPEIVRGVAYMASGWSLGSFYRNHPLVTDYIEAWKQDATMPQVVREELGALLSNEAFKRD